MTAQEAPVSVVLWLLCSPIFATAAVLLAKSARRFRHFLATGEDL